MTNKTCNIFSFQAKAVTPSKIQVYEEQWLSEKILVVVNKKNKEIEKLEKGCISGEQKSAL